MAVMKLTEAKIRDLELGSGIHRDTEVRGLMVRCHKTTKTYAVQGDVRRNKRHVRSVRVKIGRCDHIGLAEARRRARELMAQIQSGVDPTAGPPETGMTLEQALEAHLAERDLRPATVTSYREDVDRYLTRFKKRAVADITRQDCRDLLENLTRRKGRTAASSALRTLRLLVNTAMRIDETIASNPTSAVRIPTPGRREVGPLDVADFWATTETLSPIRRDMHRCFLLTGARRASMLPIRREHVDLEERTLTFAHLKTHGSLLFPMGTHLTEMLGKRMEDDVPLNSDWLWPSPTSATGHVQEAKEPRREMASPHELRHHMRTFLVQVGCPLMEGNLLVGHSLPGMASTYVHPQHLIETLRPWVQKLEDLILKEAGLT